MEVATVGFGVDGGSVERRGTDGQKELSSMVVAWVWWILCGLAMLVKLRFDSDGGLVDG